MPEERRLIALAQEGSQKSAEEIILRHIGFVIFRIHKRAVPEFLRRFGEDLLSNIWKRIDGLILDSLKKELREEGLWATRLRNERYAGYVIEENLEEV